MGKRQAGYPFHFEDECLHNVKPGEPFFVLRGQDEMAPDLVETWARQAELLKIAPEKVIEARKVAAEMRDWKPRRLPT